MDNEFDELTGDETLDIATAEEGEEHKSEENDAVEGEYEPIKFYLREMSNVPLLNKEGEVAIAREIENARWGLASATFSVPFCIKKLVSLGDLVENGEAPFVELIQNGEDIEEDDLFFRKARLLRSNAGNEKTVAEA